MADESKVQRASAQFAKLQRAEDGKKAMAEYEAEMVSVRAKTERLKALRLARDAELGAAAQAAAAKPAVKAARKPVAKSPASKSPAAKSPAAKKKSAAKVA